MSGRSAHIAIFVPSLRGGGAERVMVTLANGFAARGHRVDLVLAKAEGPYLPEVSPDVRIIDFQKSRVLKCLLPLAAYIRRERPDGMLSALTHANLIAIIARKLAFSSMRLVVSERSLPSFSPKKKSMRTSVSIGAITWLYPHADHIVAISSRVRAELVDMFALAENKVSIIPNPVNVQEIRRLSERDPGHDWLKNDQIPVVLSVGRLVSEKDYPTLLKAIALAIRASPLRLIILGEGELLIELEEMTKSLRIEEYVQFIGRKDNPFSYMSRSRCFVLASTHEGFGNVILEAMVCGAPIIATSDSGGPAEILDGGKWGQLFHSGDVEALSDAILEAANRHDRVDYSKRLRMFDVNRITDSYIDHIIGKKVATRR